MRLVLALILPLAVSAADKKAYVSKRFSINPPPGWTGEVCSINGKRDPDCVEWRAPGAQDDGSRFHVWVHLRPHSDSGTPQPEDIEKGGSCAGILNGTKARKFRVNEKSEAYQSRIAANPRCPGSHSALTTIVYFLPAGWAMIDGTSRPDRFERLIPVWQKAIRSFEYTGPPGPYMDGEERPAADRTAPTPVDESKAVPLLR